MLRRIQQIGIVCALTKLKHAIFMDADTRNLCALNGAYEYLLRYKNALQTDIAEYKPQTAQKIIWTCWLQGLENTPELVKRCIENMRQYANGYKVEVIDQNNVSQFVQRYEPQTTDELIARIRQFDKVYIYMPTWRDSQKNVFAQQMDLQQLSAVLKKQNALLLLKPHPNTMVDNIYQADNIILVERTVDIYGVLPFTDVLITDYSSILYDYLLMPAKQVILYLYDYDEYVKERDFYYPFDENVVGKQVNTFAELVNVIDEQDYQMDEKDRQRILDIFWGETMKMDSSKEIIDKVLC